MARLIWTVVPMTIGTYAFVARSRLASGRSKRWVDSGALANLAIHHLRHFPFHTGFLFSANAFSPSLRSSDSSARRA